MVSVKKIPRRSTRTATTSTRNAPTASPAITGPDLQATRASVGVDLTDSIHSPFFMHTSDHPGLQLVSLKLNGTNFDDWEDAMKIALDAKNKIGFIDGSLPRPPESDLHFRIWSRCNSLVKSWIINSVSTQIYRSILRLSDATDIWSDLHIRFHMTNLPRTYNLTQEIQDLRQGSLSLSDYFTKLKTLWSNLENYEEADDLCICGKAQRLQQKVERAKIVKFLAGLNESYAVIRRQIIMKKTLPSLTEVYNILDQDDSQKSFTTAISPTAFQVSETVTSPQESSSICYVQSGAHKGKPICSFCNKVGHIAERCYKKHGFPPGYLPKGKAADKFQKSSAVTNQTTLSTQPDTKPASLDGLIGNLSKDQIQKFIALFSSQLQKSLVSYPTEASTSQNQNDMTGINFSPSTFCFIGILTVSKNILGNETWVLDSGATHHVSHDKALFASLDTSVQNSVNLPNGSLIKISGVGNIRLNKHILLGNVLSIPKFRLNLISISSLTTDLGSRVIFDPASCEIQDRIKGMMIGQGRRIGNLYVQDVEDISTMVNAVVDIGTWHNRLGHASYSRLDLI